MESHEIVIPDREGIAIEWKVKNGSSVRRGELVLLYRSTRMNEEKQYLDNSSQQSMSNNGPSPSLAVAEKIIRAKKRGPRVIQNSQCSYNFDPKPLPDDAKSNKPLIGTLLGKILANTQQEQATMNGKRNLKAMSTSGLEVSQKDIWVPVCAPVDGCIHLYPTKQAPLQNRGTPYQALAVIVPCSHPTVIYGLCVICGKNAGDTSSTDLAQTNRPSHDSLTVSGGLTVSISSDYAASIASQTLLALRKAHKLQLVLDLDHTLVHATADPRAEYWKREGGRTDVHTILLPLVDDGPPSLNYDGTLIKHFMKFRDHLPEFLESILDKYEVIIYTAGTRSYANKTADAISRHLLNYQKSKKCNDNSEPNSPYCLDEYDLYALRARVAMMEHDAKSFRDIQKVNEKWNKDNEIDRNRDDCTEIADIKYTENGSASTQSLKRKRVSFEEDPEVTSSVMEDRTRNETESNITQMDRFDDTGLIQSLKSLREELKNAETRENEAIALRMKLFGSRIVSRTDVGDLGRDVKSLSRIFPCGGKMVAIVDDREDVWANADDFSSEKQLGEPPDNLLLTRPFHWQPFLGFEDVNNASGVDLTKQSGNPDYMETDDCQLLWTSDILSRLYQRYYSKDYTVDDEAEYETVPSILRQMRREVLGGESKTNIVLSGLIPINIQEIAEVKGSLFSRPPLLRYVESLGAKVLTDVTEETTHVVAARDGTDKVKRGRQIRNCSVVSVSWLMECYWSISLRETEPHLINKLS